MRDEALALFGYTPADLDSRLPPAYAEAGAAHLILPLNSRERLAAMRYDLAAGRAFMKRTGVVTIAWVHAESATLLHARNAFAAGGVYEDPATGRLPPRWLAICATAAGCAPGPSRSCRASTWACRRACGPSTAPSRAVRCGWPARRTRWRASPPS